MALLCEAPLPLLASGSAADETNVTLSFAMSHSHWSSMRETTCGGKFAMRSVWTTVGCVCSALYTKITRESTNKESCQKINRSHTHTPTENNTLDTDTDTHTHE